MIVQIDLRSSLPLYKQLKTGIIRCILSGELTEGDRLPSVRQLGYDLGINLHTVNKVYNLLEDEGYISILRGSGAVVKVIPGTDKETCDDFAEMLYPIIVEMRVKKIRKGQIHEIIDQIWEQSRSDIGGE